MKNKSDNALKNKHLALEDRSEISECLARGMTFKAHRQERVNRVQGD